MMGLNPLSVTSDPQLVYDGIEPLSVTSDPQLVYHGIEPPQCNQ